MKRIKLLTALSSVAPGLAKKEVIEQSTCFVFINGFVATYNDMVAVSYPINIGFEGAVPSTKLMALLNKTTVDEIEVYMDDNEFRVDGGRFRSGIPMQADIVLPLDFLKKKLTFEKLPEGFGDAIKRCVFSTAKENEYPHLSNIHVHNGIVESCDNYRATRCTVEDIGQELLLPSNAIRGILQYNFDQYCVSENWIHLTKEDGAVFSCRIYKDKYPNLDVFFEMSGRPVRLPKELTEILDRGNIFSSKEGEQEVVTVTLAPKRCVIRGENAEGWFEEEADIRRQGDETIKFAIAPQLLREILKHTFKAIVGDNGMNFRAKGFDHVVQLIPK